MAGKSTPEKRSAPGKSKPAAKGKAARPDRQKKVDGVIGDPHPTRPGDTDLVVVGVGASAGGLEALQQLFKPLAVDCGVAFVVIQHLSPNYKSAMDQLLSRTTALPVLQIQNNLTIEPNRIYLSPPEKFVSMAKGRFRLIQSLSQGGRSFLPIDHFFRSLARVKREKAVCIILSGSASDGTQGLKAVKAVGGLTIAQSPEDAGYASMPESAIASRMVDFILPAAEIAPKLLAVLKHPCIRCIDATPTDEKDTAFNLDQIFSIIRSKTGHNFSSYKRNTVSRRIARRMAVHQLNTISDYVKIMAKDPAEAGCLVKDMLIGVTCFFRDGSPFETLQEKVLTPLVQSRQPGDSVRVWVPGCSSGEEAYTIAILLAEVMERLGIPLTLQVFASDLEADAIHTARQGAYPQSISADVSGQRLARFFNYRDATYQIKKRIRDSIVFSVHNLIDDPPFSKIDLISCRNLLIYLKPELQKKILRIFHFALNPDGHLFLGSSETIGECTDCFSAVSLKHKIFKHRNIVPVDRYTIDHLPEPAGSPPYATAAIERGRPSLTDICNYTERILLDEYAPPAVLVDRGYEILNFFGHTEPYLQVSQGKASFNIMKMAREGLGFKLAQGLNRAFQTGQTQRLEGVVVKSDRDLLTTTISIRPLPEKPAGRDLLIVLFEAAKSGRPTDASEAPAEDLGETPPQVKRLEDELNNTKAHLQATIEALESSNEAYKAANEELQSVNEELQSANEELETSREELQSTNEELVTVNAEHQQKIDELTKSNNDINNLLESTEIACLFLDLNLCVRRFTPAVTRIINLRQTDLGRPVSDITTLMEAINVHEHAREVLERLDRKRLEVRDKNDRWYEMRIMPYRTIDNVIDGVTIAFIDITDVRQVHLLRRVTAVFECSSDAVTVQDFDGNILSWNRTAETLYGWTAQEATHMHISELTVEKNRHEYADVIRRLRRGETVAPFEIKRITKSGEPIAVGLHVTTLVDEKRRPVQFATYERPVESS
ncbi:CheR family methyltransferase [Desulfosarcina sp.]|uniref:CheR family methyltransferase n=1 Tax=Desulfosarcina sp. TaxID=2027861 RepID=UPI003566C3EC